MTKKELKKLIKEALSEIDDNHMNPNKELADPRIIAPSELSRYKAACQTLANKITAALIGKSMTGEFVKGDLYSRDSKRKSVETIIKSVEVELSYKTSADTLGTKFYVHVYAKGEQGQAGMISFSDYV